MFQNPFTYLNAVSKVEKIEIWKKKNCENLTFSVKAMPGWIRIRLETDVDPKHCFFTVVFPQQLGSKS